MEERHTRTAILLGEDAPARLRASHVVILGLLHFAKLCFKVVKHFFISL